MQQESKSQKISKIAAKTALRIFVIILAMGLLPLIAGRGESWEAKMVTGHLVFPSKWTLVYPAILFIGFLSLAIICIKNKYRQTDINWLLVLNSVILIAYLVILYTRIYHALLA